MAGKKTMAHPYRLSVAALSRAPIWRAGTKSELKGKRIGISVKPQAYRENPPAYPCLTVKNQTPKIALLKSPGKILWGSSRNGAVTCLPS
jgi:hypothetical protein